MFSGHLGLRSTLQISELSIFVGATPYRQLNPDCYAVYPRMEVPQVAQRVIVRTIAATNSCSCSSEIVSGGVR